jgi:hypothetical protein
MLRALRCIGQDIHDSRMIFAMRSFEAPLGAQGACDRKFRHLAA